MADLTQYPDADALYAYMKTAGVSADEADLVTAVGSAISEFEERTRWYPFLSTGSNETRTFTERSGETLDLEGGLLSLTSLTVGGSAYVQDQQFTLGPRNASLRGRPYLYVDFGCAGEGYYRHLTETFFGAGARQIAITGKWGRSLTVPANVRAAILQRAAALVYPQLLTAQVGTLSSITNADGSALKFRDVKSSPFADPGGALSFETVAANYRRLLM